ncbi:hypothetical protein GQ56_0121595 [Burkholderia paludis]|nr:hypothetical protein GQ56_0121595 [Burkholderia paludis]
MKRLRVVGLGREGKRRSPAGMSFAIRMAANERRRARIRYAVISISWLEPGRAWITVLDERCRVLPGGYIDIQPPEAIAA